MAEELAYVLITPYTIWKSRTGGVISRLLARVRSELVAARIFSPSKALIEEYCKSISLFGSKEQKTIQRLIQGYIRTNLLSEDKEGLPRRVMLLLFRGENAIEEIKEVVGHITYETVGETIRDTYGDYIAGRDGSVKYFEPAVLAIQRKEEAEEQLKIWARYSASDGGILSDSAGLPPETKPEATLVLIKPDNFKGPSVKAGNIIDLFSKTRLFIIGLKVLHMSIHQAMKFYAPVREILIEKSQETVRDKLHGMFEEEFEFDVPADIEEECAARLKKMYGEHEFYRIVKFMTGLHPLHVSSPEERSKPGLEKCLAIVYYGVSAIQKIRNQLGSTDPTKAAWATVRKEFGTDIMVNTAHASDSPASAEREMEIIDIASDDLKSIIENFYGGKK